MEQSYSEYITPIRKRLETFRKAVDQDLTGVEQTIMDLTLRQLTEMTSSLDSALQSYTDALQPYYRTMKRSRPEGQGTGYYQRRRAQETDIANRASESVTKQGYVTVAAIMSETGYKEQSVTRMLDRLASDHSWDKKRDRETKSYKYSPKTATESPSA